MELHQAAPSEVVTKPGVRPHRLRLAVGDWYRDRSGDRAAHLLDAAALFPCSRVRGDGLDRRRGSGSNDHCAELHAGRPAIIACAWPCTVERDVAGKTHQRRISGVMFIALMRS